MIPTVAKTVTYIHDTQVEFRRLFLYSHILSFCFPGVARAAQPHLLTFWGHARVELGPPGLSQWPQIKQGLFRLWNSTLTGQFLDVSMREATKNSLVAVEVACWFFVGEMIGRRSIIGYKV